MNEWKGREWEAIHTKAAYLPNNSETSRFIYLKKSLSFRVTTDAVVIPGVQAAKDLF